VFSHNGVVFHPHTNHILTDLSPDILPPPSGHRIADYPALPAPIDLDADVLTIVAPGSWKNYFHWIIDALPRLRHLDAARFDYNNPIRFDLIYTPLTAIFHRESLSNLGIDEDRWLEARIDCHYRCRSLTAISPQPLGKVDFADVEYIRKLFGIWPSQPTRRIYISRGDSWRRRILNEEAIIDYLADNGFEVHTLAGLSIAEQATLFSQAELVIAPHGAALTNLLFAPPTCRVLELFASNYLFPHYRDLSETCGLDYHAHISPNPTDAPDSSADLKTLLPTLDQFLSTVA
ncbi:MAG: glycosyltransferase family 61 protein, partial [Verrucomicrobia bacterium]|nr:glycosyltransferase family 61 protein [Verrucomicrobiota bacterium]